MMLFGLACAVAVVDQNHDSQSGSVKYSPVGFVIVIFVVLLLLLLYSVAPVRNIAYCMTSALLSQLKKKKKSILYFQIFLFLKQKMKCYRKENCLYESFLLR